MADGQEANLEKRSSITPAAVLLWELESGNLPSVDIVRFDGDPTKWPEFIKSFKTRVYMKQSFTDSICMELLISVLDGEPKKSTLSINGFGTNGVFYASALKSLKEQFDNPCLVSYYKLKILFDLPPLSANDHIGLRCYHQQLKGTLAWLQSMGYISAIKSIENVTKAITRLPTPLRIKFYREMKTSSCNQNNINSLVLERWLETKMQETFNSLASVIENKIKGKQMKTLSTR